jgi:hypothetical protein
MRASIELNERRCQALEQVVRRRKVPVQRLFEQAVDEFIERAIDQKERQRLNAETIRQARSSGLAEEADIEGRIKNMKKRPAKA